MAVGSTTILFSNGQQLNIYNSSSVVNSPLHCSMSGAATATSPYIFMVQSDTCIKDMYTTATAGDIEILANSVPTGKKFQLSGRFGAGVIRDYTIPRFCFRKGVGYSLIPRVATS
jgi:hypothetical protein